jgi:tellurite resistance protein TerC
MLTQKDVEVHPDENILIRAARKFFPVSSSFEGGRFFLRQAGKLTLTPLFLVLIAVETTDIIFAFDSIPAVFGVTRDPFIVYSSNVFAILGLRATYFLLAGIMDTFYYLSYGLSAVLIFIGGKMLVNEIYPISIAASLAVVCGILVIAVVASLVRDRRKAAREKSSAATRRT